MCMYIVPFLLRVSVILNSADSIRQARAQLTNITTSLIPPNDVMTTGYYIETATNISDHQSFTFSAVPHNENTTELNVGMKATIKLILTYPPGSYDLIKINIQQGGPYMDIGNVTCKWGVCVSYGAQSEDYVTNYGKTGFGRWTAYQIFLERANVAYSDTLEKRQHTCDSDIYFHNAEGLTDGQNISVIARATVKSGSDEVVFKDTVVFTARTSVLDTNKTAYYKLGPGVATEIFSEFKSIKKIVFRSWIPYYNPHIEVTLNYGNGTLSNTTVWASYLRVLSVGRHFIPGARKRNLLACHFSYLSSGHISLGFPSQWVNRGYYDSQNTTDDDLIKFEAGVAILAPDYSWINNKVDIGILLNGTQNWTSTISLVVNESISNISEVHLNGTSLRDLFPHTCNQTSLIMTISTPKESADILKIRVSTYELTTTNEPALRIDSIRVNEIGENFLCTNFSVTYHQTPDSSVQNLALVTFHYLNIGNDEISNNIIFEIDIKIDTSKTKLGHTHVVSAVVGESISEYFISFNKPEVLGDKNGTIMSQVHKILDSNYTTCLNLPVKGAVPPLLWMKVNTSWLNISSAEYIVTVVGMHISCTQHGQRILQVSFPTTNSRGFQGDMSFCLFTSEDVIPRDNLTKCVYNCQCKNTSECQDMVLFMAKQDDISEWSLCELSAYNVH